jgi:outer membrane protein assembly factor BamB
MMPGQVLGSPVIDDEGRIYVGAGQIQRGQTPRGMLVCIDGNSHNIRWQCPAAGPVESTPVLGNDHLLYFGDNTGLVHAVDFTGKVAWTAQLNAPVRSAGTLLAPGRLAFGLDNDTLLVLRCSSSELAHAGWPKILRNLAQNGFASS